MKRTIAMSIVIGGLVVMLTAQQGTKPQVYKGLEVAVTSVERAPSGALNDCPPGENTQKAMARAGEQMAIVTIAVKVLPAYQRDTIIKRPTVTDTAGKTYNTAVSFVDVAKAPAFSCAIPFRVPEGIRLKSLNIDTLSVDLGAFESKKR